MWSFVQMSRPERSEIGPAVRSLGQQFHGFVHDREARVVVVLGLLDVMQVDLQHGVGVDDHGRAVAAADGSRGGT
jgi:hypothetical protein